MRGGIVGRGAELAALRASLEEAASGRRRLVLLSGEPGIGKSRLLDAFAGDAAGAGATVAWGRCWEAGGAPAYWPWTELLRQTLRNLAPDRIGAVQRDIGRAAQLLPELGDPGAQPEHGAEDPDSARFALFEAVSQLFRSAAEDRPLVLLLDDLHAADESSLLLLQFLAAEPAPARLLVVAAYRGAESMAGRPLAQVAHDLTRLTATARLELTGLSRDEVAELTEITTAVAPSALLADRLREKTDGNPLYVGEVVRLLAAEGRLEGSAAIDRISLPHDVRETVLRRLERLPAETKRVLATASVFGRDFRIDALARLVDPVEPLTALADAEAAHLVAPVLDQPAHLRFSHAVIAEALYDEMPLATRLDLHARAGETLEKLLAADVERHLAELARHFCAAVPAGDARKAVAYSMRAGAGAVSLLAYEEGARLYALAVRTMEATGTATAEERTRGLLALGDAQARAGDAAAAKDTFLRAADLARATGDRRDLAQAALGYGGRFVWFRSGTDTKIVPLLQEALASLPEGDGGLQARLLARLAGALRDEPTMDERDRLSAEALAIARQLGDPSLLVYALAGRWAALWGPDHVEELTGLAAELEAVVRQVRDAERRMEVSLMRFEAAAMVGNIEHMRRCEHDIVELAETLRQPPQLWYASLVRSVMLLLEGDVDAAVVLADETRRVGRRAQGSEATASWLLTGAVARWEQNRLPELESELTRATLDHRGYAVFKCFLALLHAEAGRADMASRLLADLLPGGSEPLPADNGWLSGMTVLAEVASLLQDRAGAAAVEAALLPHSDLIGLAGGEAVTGSIQHPLGQVATVLGRYDEAEGRFEAALAVHARMAAPILQCHTEYEWARMLLQRKAAGDVDRAHDLLASARRRTQQIGLPLLASRIATLTSGAQPRRPRPPADATTDDRGGPLFRRDGEYWAVRFGGQPFRLRHSKGLEYLAALLARPGTDIAAIDLATTSSGDRRGAAGLGGRGPEGDTGEVLDRQARAEYRRRLEELQADLDEAEEWGDRERAARAKAEIDFLATELAGAVGLAGKPRRMGSAAERARQSVRKAVSAALERIRAQDPELARHLTATVRTGYVCRYEPDPRAPVEWRT